MEELMSILEKINSLSDLENIDNINPNALLYAIAKSERYDLLEDANIRVDISDELTLEKLVDFLLSDDSMLYYMHRNGFTFSKYELNIIFNIVLKKYIDSYKFDNFFRDFFANDEELNNFIKEHEQFFINYINEKGERVSSKLKNNDSFVELILKGNHEKLITQIQKYSLSNLKLLAKFLKKNKNIPHYLGDYMCAQHLFDLKSDLEPEEFVVLLNLLQEKVYYDYPKNVFFTNLVKENIDYLIDVVSQTKTLPKCLAESSVFRDQCIKRNRIDLAVKCVLPSYIIDNEKLINAYCAELHIDRKNFYERIKWILDYLERNNNIFNTFLATSLKDNIFIFNKEHFERFINDVSVQMSLTKLNDKELLVISKILNIYDYKEYDITSMIINIINNIGNYKDLIDSLDLENISEQDLRKLVGILQFSSNQYQVTDVESLRSYDKLKRQFLVNNFESNDLISNKDSLLKALFNIDLSEAQYINSKYCYNTKNENVLKNLKNSELPPKIYNYLELINRIVECDNLSNLSILYNSLKHTKVYDLEIPFESYLRAEYTKLYSKSLYRIDERNQVYGPKDSISSTMNFNGKKVQVCIPRTNFNFFIHCVGSCSLATDVTDTNYKNDWLNRPQLQDHFVACSYINEQGIYSIRAQGSIIFCFDTLESGSILSMGNSDIDSIGPYANAYGGSRELQKENNDRARFFVPSEILKTISDGYNEIVVERRNTDKSRSKEFKRKPDYIIMMAESLSQDNFNYLETLYQNQLSFILDEDKKIIQKIGDIVTLKKFLAKYKSIISQHASIRGITVNNMADVYVDLIMKAKYYEDCLKAASDFDIPLVIVDKEYYFKKALLESKYDDDTKKIILDFYLSSPKSSRQYIYNSLIQGRDITALMQKEESKPIKISLL